MELKRCRNCEHFRYKYHASKCTRYPEWVYIDDLDEHWCGEWKKIEDNQEEDNCEFYSEDLY